MPRSSTAEDLPEELLENVLARLPVHDLCRAGVVSKTWRHVALQPSLTFLRSITPRPISTVFISPRGIYIADDYQRTKWEVLDATENRSYTFLDPFISDQCDQNDAGESLLPHDYRWFKYTVAANGGLIYAIYDKFPSPRNNCQFHVVCNPVRKTFHKIMEPWSKCLSSYERDIVVMSMDNVTNTYKIIFMDVHSNFQPTRGEVHLYDSTTSVWKRLCAFPEQHYRAISGIFLNGAFYALFMDLTQVPWYPLLFTCDLATSAWSHIDVDLSWPSCLQDKSQLVVVSGRLFIVEYTGVFTGLFNIPRTRWESQLTKEGLRKKYLIDLSIWEIMLATEEVMKVAEMTNFSKYDDKWLDRLPRFCEMVVAVGCADSIVISCTMGRRVAFDLTKNCWRELLPYQPIFKYPMGGVCGGAIDF